MQTADSIDKYLESLGNGALPTVPSLIGRCDARLTAAVHSLALSSHTHPLLRRLKIGKMFKGLVRCGFINPIRLRFSYSFEEKAYMRDRGDVTVSMPYVGTEKGGTLCKVLLHEVAHIFISQCEHYSSLTALDAEYRAAVGRCDRELLILSPIELYATLVSIELLSLFASAYGRLLQSPQKELNREQPLLLVTVS